MSKNDIIICRCEDVSLQDLHDCLDEGYTTFEEVKRILRVGMGPCQGNSCGLLIQKEISKHLNTPLNKIKIHKIRPLTSGVKISSIVENAKNES